MTTRTEKAIKRASYAKMLLGLDLKKDFFDLDGQELQKLEQWKKENNFKHQNHEILSNFQKIRKRRITIQNSDK